jgi:hypothetical protein
LHSSWSSVGGLVFDEVEHVGEPGAAAALHADAEPRLVFGQVLALDDLLDLGGSFQ